MRAVLRIVAFLIAGCGGDRVAEHAQRASVPPELTSSYDLFSRRCSKCHSLSRPLDSGIDSDEEWQSYVERMRLMPGSGISSADATEILRFIRFYAAGERRRRAGGT